MSVRITGLWRDPDFLKLWAARTVSEFGTLMGALQFTAVLVLGATPLQMGTLVALRRAPGAVVGFLAGPWVDRHRKRPIMIATDLGRAALFASIPIMYVVGELRIEQVYAVAFFESILTAIFDVAYRSYLPVLISHNDLLEANSKLTGSEAFVEVTGFSVGGWVAQIFSAIGLALADALTFLASAISLAFIRTPEQPPQSADGKSGAAGQLAEGLVLVWRDPILRAFVLATVCEGVAFGVYSATILIFGTQELGMQPGLLGTIAALGGVSSLLGSLFVGRISRRFGIGPVMVGGFLLFAISMYLVPMARGPLAVAALFLMANQLGDGFMTMYQINQISLRQAITLPVALGRVNAILRSAEMTGLLLGAMIGGALAGVIGIRAAMVLGATVGLAGAGFLLLSPALRLKDLPSPDNIQERDVSSP